MQSSFRIIKGQDIEKDPQLSPVETKVKIPNLDLILQDDRDEELEEDLSQENALSDIDIDKIKETLRKQLYREMAHEKNLILIQANQEAEKIREEAREEGYRDGIKKGIVQGYEKGMDEAQKDSQSIKESALDMVKQAEEYVEAYYEENEERIIRLAGDIAESIVHKTIDTSSEDLLMLIRPVVQQYRNKKQIIISVHPDNSEFLKNNIDRLIEDGEKTNFVILKDGNLEKNGCTIENENQIIDLGIKKQIDNILNHIRNME